MLPRQNKNAIKIDINQDDDAEDIEAKRMEAQKNYGIQDNQPREASMDPKKNLDENRGRQQSFGVPSGRPSTGNMKNSQHVTKQVQPPPQTKGGLERRGTIGSDKNIKFNESPNQGNKLGSLPRTNSAQISNPKGLGHGNGMDEEGPPLYSNHSQVPGYGQQRMNNFMDNKSANYNSNHHKFSPSPQNGYQQPYQNRGNSQANSDYTYSQQHRNYGNSNQFQGYGRQQMRPPQPAKPIIPEDWDSMLEFMNGPFEQEYKNQVQQKIHENLYQ